MSSENPLSIRLLDQRGAVDGHAHHTGQRPSDITRAAVRWFFEAYPTIDARAAAVAKARQIRRAGTPPARG